MTEPKRYVHNCSSFLQPNVAAALNGLAAWCGMPVPATTEDRSDPPAGYEVWDFYEGLNADPDQECWLWRGVGMPDDDGGDMDDQSRAQAVSACWAHQDAVIAGSSEVAALRTELIEARTYLRVTYDNAQATEDALREQLATVTRERDEMQASFDLRWKAGQRAIGRWRAAAPGRELIRPDHADLCVWLMDELATLRKRIADAEALADRLIEKARHHWLDTDDILSVRSALKGSGE